MKSLGALSREIAQIRKQMTKFTDSLPRIVGVESVKIVKQNFVIEAYDSGNGVTKWPKRKPATNAEYDRGRVKNKKTGKLSKYRAGKNGRYKGSVYSSRNPLLRQTLALFKSIHYRERRRIVFVGVDLGVVPYARAHNEGLGRQPRRQYMPYKNQQANPKIINVIRRRIDYETAKIMRTFRR